MVAVSQAPVVFEVAAVATPAAGGATLAALPSAVQDLAWFFLSLSGSASLGAAGGIADVAAPASGAGVQLCPLAPGGGAVAFGAATVIPAGAGGPPSALAAVPGSSGRQQRQETSRPSRRRRRRSSSDRTDRRSKKRPRGRSPSPGPSSRRQEMTEPRLLLPELDVRLEVLLAIFAPFRRVTACTVLALRVERHVHPRERTIIARVLVVDPTRLRVERMTAGLVLWTR